MYDRGYNLTRVTTTSCIILVILFIAFQSNHPMWFRRFRSDAKVSRVCTPDDVQNDMLALTYDIHMILKTLNITHFLIYGSLWGALRMNRPLPWDDDVDLGMIEDGKYPLITSREFLKRFRQKDIRITDNMDQKSSFKFERGKGAVDLMIYYEYGKWMKRRGWEAWLLTLHYNLHHTFPKAVINGALPQRKFGWFMMPVPRNGMEIMKHMYRYDWWVEYKMESCK